MAQEHQNCINELKSMHKELDREIEEKRREFLRKLIPLVRNWQGRLPNLRDILRPEEIDWLLAESLKVTFDNDDRGIAPETLIDFVIKTGYKDEPVLGEDGKPSSRRDTPIHEAAKRYHRDPRGPTCFNTFLIAPLLVGKLFKIYDRFDVNYTDKYDFSHFHAACKCECYDEVVKFIKLGQDPNCVPLVEIPEESPLFLALVYDEKMFKLLLKYGASPYLSYSNGLPLLHYLCTSVQLKYLYDRFFKFADDIQMKVQIDAEDKNGRTPLQSAVANLALEAIDKLLVHDADLSKFIFPSPNYIVECFDSRSFGDDYRLKPASGLPAVVERLEKRGYVLDRSDARTVMELYVEFNLLVKPPDNGKRWLDDEEYVIKAKRLMFKPSLSVYNLLQLRPKEAAKLVTYKDYEEFEYVEDWWNLPQRVREDFEILLCEKVSRRFFQKWALDSFQELTRYRLPIICSEMIVDQLINRDLYRIFLAATELRSLYF